jgi:hypothetical protein
MTLHTKVGRHSRWADASFALMQGVQLDLRVLHLALISEIHLHYFNMNLQLGIRLTCKTCADLYFNHRVKK